MFLLVFSLFIGGVGTFILCVARSPGETAIGLVLVIPSAFFLLLAVFLALPNSAYLELTAEGFRVKNLFRATLYRWGDVTGAFAAIDSGLRGLVCFNFRPDFPLPPRARKLAHKLAGYDGALPNTYGMSARDLAALLNEWKARHASTPAQAEASAPVPAAAPAAITWLVRQNKNARMVMLCNGIILSAAGIILLLMGIVEPPALLLGFLSLAAGVAMLLLRKKWGNPD
jgi:hypothetical protein